MRYSNMNEEMISTREKESGRPIDVMITMR